MRLEITDYGLSIVTETVQDVAYLKGLGYQSDNKDIVLKVRVSELWGDCMPKGHTGSKAVQLNFDWEDKNMHSECCGGDQRLITYAEGEQRPPRSDKVFRE